MKKILPYIFILTIIVQLFAPFSVSQKDNNGQKKIFSRENVVFAEDEDTGEEENEDLLFQDINIETTLVEKTSEIDLDVRVSGNTSIAFSSWATIFSYQYY